MSCLSFNGACAKNIILIFKNGDFKKKSCVFFVDIFSIKAHNIFPKNVCVS